MDNLFIYIDETGKEGFYGVCAVLTEIPIEQSVIDEAMADLRADKTAKAMDQEALSEGYFHANRDGKSAISCLARSIGRNISAIVLYSHRKISVTNQAEAKTSKLNNLKKPTVGPLEAEYRLHTVTNIIEAIDIPAKVNIYYEQRDKFKEPEARELEKGMFLYLEKQLLSEPLCACFQPHITWHKTDKKNPGTQVTDLVLWSINNSILDKPSSRSNSEEIFALMNLSKSIKAQNSHNRMGRYLINRRNSYFASQILPYPENVDFSISTSEDCFQLFKLAEETIHRYSKESLPGPAQHLTDAIRMVSRKYRENSYINPDEIPELASLFIKIFDIIPVYANLSKDDERFHELLKARFVSAKICHESSLVSRRMKNYISRRRHAT